MTILFAYDGSESADAAIAAAGQLLGDGRFATNPPRRRRRRSAGRSTGETARLRCRTPESSRPAFGGQPNVELLPRRAVRVPKATS